MNLNKLRAKFAEGLKKHVREGSTQPQPSREIFTVHPRHPEELDVSPPSRPKRDTLALVKRVKASPAYKKQGGDVTHMAFETPVGRAFISKMYERNKGKEV